MATTDPVSPPEIEDLAPLNVVLVVEDEILIRMAISDHLRDEGFKVYEAANAHEAIDLLSHYGEEIDAVFTDIMMPGEMDGLALVEWVRQHWPAVPVILTSGVTDMGQTSIDMRNAGLFFLKPYDMDRVAALITQKAAARAQARGAS